MGEWVRPARVVVVLAAALVLFMALAAQAAAANIDFRVAAFNCMSDPGPLSLAKGAIPSDCTPATGVAFTVSDTSGAPLANCTTNASGLCILSLTEGSTVVVAEDPATAPEGFVPRENPISTPVETEFASAVFVNLPAAQIAPQTGRPLAAAESPSALPLALGAFGLVLLGLGLGAQRRRA
ncbi:MAG TPA: hypothetical protein VFI42_11865 [Thermomicrobiaceae bacterium]|nr:hypothetical protein [Thermomicrobiaceae bacterium]